MAYFLDADLAKMVKDEQGGSSRRTFAPRTTTTGPSAATGGGRTNKYPAPCLKCGRKVPAGQGSLEKANGAWVTTHVGGCPS